MRERADEPARWLQVKAEWATRWRVGQAAEWAVRLARPSCAVRAWEENKVGQAAGWAMRGAGQYTDAGQAAEIGRRLMPAREKNRKGWADSVGLKKEKMNSFSKSNFFQFYFLYFKF